MTTFSDRLKEALKKRSITQVALAEKINVAQQAVNYYCSAKKMPSLPVFQKICEVLDESSDYLLGLTDIPK